jgi:signal transduction histidine kinase
VPLLDEETGRVIGSRGILYDDNHRQRILDNILESRNHADEAERLQAAFLHNISHEIRTPLNAIVGFSTLLEECSDSPERRREYLEIILRSSDHLLEIIDDIMEISKIEAGTVTLSREKVDLNLMLRKVYDQFNRIAAEKGIILNYFAKPDAGDPEIYTDSYKVTQVLRNLVSNGLKFTCEGSVEFGYVRKEKDIEFFVSDTGIGIPREQQADIFSVFYQGDSTEKRYYGGTGLGLTIAKAYVELMGGVIWFTSEPGKGSEFRFRVEMERGEGDK